MIRMYECFHCGARAVIWQSDFMGSELGYDREGIVHECHCANCGAEITYFIPNEVMDMNTEWDVKEYL